ncbi:MAG: sulfotransferase domain-containing protein [Bacteroidota bacterium]
MGANKISDKLKLDFVGIGASKSGTTWLASQMQKHPDIYLPNKKELHFFNGRNIRYDPNLENIKKYYKGVGSKVKGEFTPRYYISEKAIKRIVEHNENVKLILILRDPIERMISQHKYFVTKRHREPFINFKYAIFNKYFEDYVIKSQYAKHLNVIYKYVDVKNLHVCYYDDIKMRPRKLLRSVENYLGLDNKIIASDEVVNKGSVITGKKYSELVNGYMKFHNYNKVLSVAIRKMVSILDNYVDVKPIFEMSEIRYVYERYIKHDLYELNLLVDKDLSNWINKYNR